MTEFLVYRLKIGHRATRAEIARLTKGILDEAEKDLEEPLTDNDRLFKDNLPGNTWIHRFLERHPELSYRKQDRPGRMKKQVSEENVGDWFSNLEDFMLSDHQIIAKDFFIPENASRIFNLAEIGFSLSGENKISVLTCVSADGNYIKPFVTFPGERRTFNFKGVNPQDYEIGNTPNGCISSDNYFEWFSKLFFDAIKDVVEFPIVVFMDGNSSHINIALAEFCRYNSIILYCHTSNIQHQLNISVYDSLKCSMYKSVNDFKSKHNGMITKSCFLIAFDRAWQTCKENPQNIISGFMKAGIVPLDYDALDNTMVVEDNKSTEEFNIKLAPVSAELKPGLSSYDHHSPDQNLDNLFTTKFYEGFDVLDYSDQGKL